MTIDRPAGPATRLSRRAVLRLGVSLVAVAGLARATRAQSPAPSRESAPRSGPAVALLLPRATDDQGAADDLADAMDRAQRELGVRASVTIATDPGAWDSALARLVGEGAAVIVGAFPETAAAIARAARDHPAVRFIHIDGPLDPGAPPNLGTVSLEAHQGWYLAGILAGDVSRARHTGYVGAVEDDAHRAAANAFARGTQEGEGEMRADAGFVAPMGDAAAGVDIAVEQLALGADVLAADAGPSDAAIVATARQTGTLSITGSEVLAAASPDTVIATVAVLRGQALLESLRPALAADWTPRAWRAGIADGMVELVVNEAFQEAGPADLRIRVGQAQDLVNTARAAIVAGTIVVPRDVGSPA